MLSVNEEHALLTHNEHFIINDSDCFADKYRSIITNNEWK